MHSSNKNSREHNADTTAIIARITCARDDDLWDRHIVAAFLSMSLATVQGRVITHPSFPRPLIVPGTRKKRWRSGEVRAYCLAEQNRLGA